jgi:4,5-dihydroxyphthalate decarboxylase
MTETLRIALGDYPHTAPLKSKQITSASVALDFADIKPVYKAFAEMVRKTAYDVSEMAIVTYLQAKSYGKPLVLMPCVMLGRFQHGTLLYNAERGKLSLSDLPGRRVGVRSYTQTTGTWLRGHLQNDYGVDIYRVHWVNFEDAHVLEYRDPPFVERASEDKNLLKMVQEGELDAGIFGAELPTDPRLMSVIPDPEAETQRWRAKHGVVPLNHMVVVTESLSKSKPEAVREVFRMIKQAKQAAGMPKAGAIDFHPLGIEACRPALKMIINYAVQQKLIPRPFEVDELFDDTTRALE